MLAFGKRIRIRKQGYELYDQWDRTLENGTIQPTAKRRGGTSQPDNYGEGKVNRALQRVFDRSVGRSGQHGSVPDESVNRQGTPR